MSEHLYEGMFLLDSNRFSAEPEATERQVLGILERCGATVVVSRPWQENKLAYPVGNHRKGLYYLACFKMDGEQMPELARLCKLNEAVLRQLIIHHPQVIFDAMVEALNSHDGALHSPEQRPDSPREGGGEGRAPEEGAGEEER